MGKHARTVARLVAGVAVVVSSLAAAQAPAAAGGTEISIRIGPEGPQASVVPGTTSPVGTVSGVVGGAIVDLTDCTVSGHDPATVAAGTGTLTLSGCVGSVDAASTDERIVVRATASWGTTSSVLHCEWTIVNGVGYVECWYVTTD